MGLRFEEIKKGMRKSYGMLQITREIVDAHVKLYGWDWPTEFVPRIQEAGIVPFPVVISAVGGLAGKADWLAIRAMKEYRAQFFEPIHIDDVIDVYNIVEQVVPRRSPIKPHGFVKVAQFIRNQDKHLCYRRDLVYAVWRKEIREMK